MRTTYVKVKVYCRRLAL